VRHTLLKGDKSPVSKGEEHHVKNEDEIDESHKSQLKFYYEVYLLNSHNKKNYIGLVRVFFKNLGF